MREDDELSLTTIDRSMPDDSGWKQVHGDVFRPPAHLELFAIIYGTGWQLVVLVFAVVLQAMLRELCVVASLLVCAQSLPYSLLLSRVVPRLEMSPPTAGILSAAARPKRSLFFTPSRAS